MDQRDRTTASHRLVPSQCLELLRKQSIRGIARGGCALQLVELTEVHPMNIPRYYLSLIDADDPDDFPNVLSRADRGRRLAR